MNTEAVVNVVGRWAPSDVAFIRSLYYAAQSAANPSEIHLECVLIRRDTTKGGWPTEDAPRFKLDLRFIGITDLRIREFGAAETQIMGFSIIDVSDRGWEGVNYEIEDYENDRIHFLCRQVEVVGVSPL